RARFKNAIVDARVNIENGKIAACNHKEVLSDLKRINALEALRTKHIEEIRGDGLGAAADGIVEAVNRVYADEAKSFFYYENIKEPLDLDIVKDFPTFIDTIRKS